MRLVFKLLFGLGTSEEDFKPTLFNLFMVSVNLMLVFFGSLLAIIYSVSLILEWLL